MANPVVTNFTYDSISIILDKVLKTRLQRKAKSIIISSVQCILSILAVLLTVMDWNFEKNWQQELTYGLLGVSMFYVFFIMMFLFVNARRLPHNIKTTIDVETAYSKTNMIPLLDSIFEIHFPVRFRGNSWYFAYIIWLLSAGLIAGNLAMFLLVSDDLSASTITLLISAALILYQITGDFAEYWVHSRNQEPDPTMNE